MKHYWVEGLYVTLQVLKKARRSGRSPTEVEPFAKGIWAASPEDAIRLASEELGGGEWIEGPQVSRTTETERMQALGAPMLPGFGGQATKKRTRRGGQPRDEA